MKVWLLGRRLVDWNKQDQELDIWLHKTEQGAKKVFDEELEAYYERFGKAKQELYTEYYVTEDQVSLKIDNISFDLWYELTSIDK